MNPYAVRLNTSSQTRFVAYCAECLTSPTGTKQDSPASTSTRRFKPPTKAATPSGRRITIYLVTPPSPRPPPRRTPPRSPATSACRGKSKTRKLGCTTTSAATMTRRPGATSPKTRLAWRGATTNTATAKPTRPTSVIRPANAPGASPTPSASPRAC